MDQLFRGIVKEFAKKLFSIQNGHETFRAAMDNSKTQDEVKSNYPEDHKLGEYHFKKHRNNLIHLSLIYDKNENLSAKRLYRPVILGM